MIGWQFWNNPLVVSSFRVKYRRSAPVGVLSFYLLLTASVGFLLKYFETSLQFPIPWHSFYFVGLFGVQTALSAFLAMAATYSSINTDVVNRTFDFQRIAAMPPHEILLGKLLGEPAIAYLLMLAAVPMLVFAATLGAVSGPVLLLLFVNLLTSTLLGGAFGLIHSLEISNKKGANNWNPIVGGIAFMFIFAQWSVAAVASGRMSKSWVSASVGIVTPVSTLYGVVINDVWGQGLEMFGWHFPFLVVTPLVQLFVAAVLFRSMCRRIVSPVLPFLSKYWAYLLLLFVDVLAAGLLWDDSSGVMGGLSRMTAFCATHTAVALVLCLALTPSRECVRSWIWRFRDNAVAGKDFFVGDRSLNTGWVTGQAFIGLVVFLFGMVIPDWIGGAADPVTKYPMELGEILAALILFGATHALFFQLVRLVLDKGAAVFLFIVLVILFAVPIMLGAWKESNTINSISPLWWLFSMPNTFPTNAFQRFGVLGIYLVAMAGTLVWTRGWLAFNSRRIHEKLDEMGVRRVHEPTVQVATVFTDPATP